MSAYETQRLVNINRNQALLKDLGLESKPHPPSYGPIPKKRKINRSNTPQPTRSSSRIASLAHSSNTDADEKTDGTSSLHARGGRSSKKVAQSKQSSNKQITKNTSMRDPIPGVELLVAGWTDWRPIAEYPIRDTNGTFRFADHEDFSPNKSPEEILREGCFGGSYFRPLYSKHLGITVSQDWKEIPPAWISGLNVDRMVISAVYDAEINKFGVACGQSIEEWEANGWINHKYDVRGWFQWYCRFFLGRRCEDDERQISRWKKCVGETGRWRRLLLKKYKVMGVRHVFDDGEEEDPREVSPVMHQTCHHWAFEVKQEILDALWASEE